MNQNAIETLLRILRRADRLATVAMHGDVPDYEMSEELSGVCGELIALIEDNCLSDDEPTPELLAVARAVTRADQADTIQIVWESLNGVMHDLSVGQIVDANETVGDMINLLEQAGANPDKED